MERIKPMLGDVELQQVQQLDIDADQVLTEHNIPALEGNFYQPEGRRGSLITVSGVLSGVSLEEDDELNPATGLKALREKFKAAQPLSFVSDIISATDLNEVLIEDLEITEIAGKPNRFEYAFRLREFTPAPAEPIEPTPIIPPIQTLTATLIVEVIVVGNSAFDFNRVSVTVKGTQTDGNDLFRTLTNRNNNVWTEEDFPAGKYTVQALVVDTPQMRDSKEAEVREGETTTVELVLQEGVLIAQTFMIHYRFDSAFVEPCMLKVLKQVSEFAVSHANHKFLILGHTDRAGSTEYNQALSERRSRSAFSVLRFANDNQAAIDEWDQIRRTRVSGPSLGDSWGTREYQQMLQELSFYSGAIDGDHGPVTDAAVRTFQDQNALAVDGNVGDTTWPVLIREYILSQNLSVADNVFFENCPGEILKWLGCSELDPVDNRDVAWRPNRRTEFLFVQDDSLPSDVAQPDTFNKPSAGSVNSAWCLNDSGVTSRCCIVEPHLPPGKETCNAIRPPWPREAAEPQPVFVVKGSIEFGDGTPFVGQYTLIAPDGEFMDGEVPVSTSSQRAGTGFKGTTEADGSFAYPTPAEKLKRPGIFTLEVDGDFVIQVKGGPIEEAKGPVACKRLAADSDSFDVVIIPAALVNIIPTITAPSVVVVKRPHTNPQRQPVVLQVNQAFAGTGIFTRTPDNPAADISINFFTAAAGGTALQFDGVDNVFTDVQLVAGVTLFSEGGPNNSGVLDDITLTLQIVVGGQNGRTANAQMTSVLITLDISEPRTDRNIEPPFLSDIAKADVGRFVLPQNTTFDRPRAILTVHPPLPVIPDDLQLNLINGQLQLFTLENPRDPVPPQTALTNPQTLSSASIPAAGSQFFVEGLGTSGAFRDTGVQLGIAGIEPDGDRVLTTVLNGDPSLAGLFNVGEHEYTEAQEGNLTLPRPGGVVDNSDVFDPPTGGTPTITVRNRAVVRYPADANGVNVAVSAEQTNYPLIVVLHGNHRPRLDDGVTFVESHRGLEYLCRHLASHGYIALTIDVDDINGLTDGIFHRGAAVLEHIRIMKNRNANPPAVAGDVDLQGKIDESQIFLIGHSRGGEGVLAAENINQLKSQNHDIQGVMSIAPTNFEDLAHNTTPLFILYGSSDGDVSGSADGVNPFLIYDRAAAPKSMIFVYGGIHNRFSTNADWLDPRFIDNDDAQIIGAAEHINIAQGYATAFFEDAIRGPIGFDTFFKDYELPASANAVAIHQQTQDISTLIIDDFAQATGAAGDPLIQRLVTRASTNTLGNLVNQTNLVIPSASLGGAFVDPLTETQLTNDFIQFFVHDGEGGMLAWDASGAIYQTDLGSQDASGFNVISFRVTQRFGSARNTSGAVQDFTVELSDGPNSASMLVSTRTNIPFPFERHNHATVHGPIPTPITRFVDFSPDSPAVNKSALKTIRLRLADFVVANSSLNLSSLATLTLTFDQTASGEIAVDNIEFSN